jgi:hypothetical protein
MIGCRAEVSTTSLLSLVFIWILYPQIICTGTHIERDCGSQANRFLDTLNQMAHAVFQLRELNIELPSRLWFCQHPRYTLLDAIIPMLRRFQRIAKSSMAVRHSLEQPDIRRHIGF